MIDEHPEARSKTLWVAPGVLCVSANFRRFAFPRHVHETFSIGLIERGTNRFAHRGERRVAPVGTLCAVNPDEAHTGEADADGWAYVNVYLDEAVVRRLLGLPPSATVGLRGNVLDDRGVVAAMRALAALLRDPDSEPSARECELARFVAELARFADASHPGARPSSAKLARARALLASVSDRPVSVGDIAAEVGVGTAHLVRSFSRAYGISPYAYHLSRRVAAAQRLIAAGTPVAQVARATGFADQAHLTRHVRRLLGATPGALR
jgi:AraC-like DNA-binding protein